MQQPCGVPHTFWFKPRGEAELVVTGPGGSFVLDLSTEAPSACLPTEAAWRAKAPGWAADLWPVLRADLQQWCWDNKARLCVEAAAAVRPL